MTPPTIPPSVRERPIIMTGESVRAVLEGRKTQTRRVVQQRGRYPVVAVHGPVAVGHDLPRWTLDCRTPKGDVFTNIQACPYGQPGDRLWVRETFAVFTGDEGTSGLLYRADPMYDACNPGDFGWDWKPSIYMPRWASRLTLEITEVRVQRVQEITPDDAMAEGALLEEDGWHNPDIWFEDAWDRLNAKRGYSWESNPWVWAITFKVVPHD